MNRFLMTALLAASGLCGTVAGAAAAELGRPEKVTVTQVEERIETRTVPRTVTVTRLIEAEPAPAIALSTEDKQLIARVVCAEAIGEDMIGKRLVADTVLNRLRNNHWPATVAGVVWQPGQYAVSGYYTDECMEAVELECKNGVLDEYITYFCNYGFMPYGDPAYQHGGHYFNWMPVEYMAVEDVTD